jgi:AcrR family transcriptional regulator
MPASPKGLRTVAAFLDAARRVFAEKGYFNAKISDIAKAAGRSPGSFYNYYENKEEILEALLEEFTHEVLSGSQLNRNADPLENIRATVRAYWNTYRKYLAEMIGLFQMSMTDPAYTERWRENRAAGVKGVIAVNKAAEKAGHKVGLDHGTLASAVVAMLESFCWTWLAAGGDSGVKPPDDETAIETLSQMWYRTVFLDTAATAARTA